MQPIFLLCVLAGIVIASTQGGSASAEPLAQTDVHGRIGLVIQFDAERIHQECVAYRQGMSGYDVLRSSVYSQTLEAEASGLGAAVCKIAATGCTLAEGCFCQCQGDSCRYWAYYTQTSGVWQLSPVGAGTRPVRPGDVEGWAWGPGGSAAPVNRTYEQVCGLWRLWLPLVGA